MGRDPTLLPIGKRGPHACVARRRTNGLRPQCGRVATPENNRGHNHITGGGEQSRRSGGEEAREGGGQAAVPARHALRAAPARTYTYSGARRACDTQLANRRPKSPIPINATKVSSELQLNGCRCHFHVSTLFRRSTEVPNLS